MAWRGARGRRGRSPTQEGPAVTGRAPLQARPALTVLCSLRGSPATALLRSEFHLSTHVAFLVEDANGNQAKRGSLNPWGLHCHQAHLTRLCTEYPENKQHHILPASLPRCQGRRGTCEGGRGE